MTSIVFLAVDSTPLPPHPSLPPVSGFSDSSIIALSVAVPAVAIIAVVLAAYMWGVNKKSRSARHVIPANESTTTIAVRPATTERPPLPKSLSRSTLQPQVACTCAVTMRVCIVRLTCFRRARLPIHDAQYKLEPRGSQSWEDACCMELLHYCFKLMAPHWHSDLQVSAAGRKVRVYHAGLLADMLRLLSAVNLMGLGNLTWVYLCRLRGRL